ncbi:hypothetical protein NPIL_194421 [Nephila pilipes]|uniref:Uncharacterized protein n=1 Tax=Nephila pilipes TaxID=299642 RepID=A0A8X6MCX8_NEPPI|nr:hypothetical protein NPIL_194421 [Nephila pilipes]
MLLISRYHQRLMAETKFSLMMGNAGLSDLKNTLDLLVSTANCLKILTPEGKRLYSSICLGKGRQPPELKKGTVIPIKTQVRELTLMTSDQLHYRPLVN